MCVCVVFFSLVRSLSLSLCLHHSTVGEPTNFHSIVIAWIECSLIFINFLPSTKNNPGRMCMHYKCVSLSHTSVYNVVSSFFFCVFGPIMPFCVPTLCIHRYTWDMQWEQAKQRHSQRDQEDMRHTHSRKWEDRKFAKRVKRTVFVRSDYVFSQHNSIVCVSVSVPHFVSPFTALSLSLLHSFVVHVFLHFPFWHFRFIPFLLCLPDVISFSKAII